jgi:hypothetical protein
MLQILGGHCEVKLTRCTIWNHVGHFSATKLTLQEIGADQDLTPILQYWDGVALCIKKCLSFTDEVLDEMNVIGPHGGRVIAPSLSVLHVDDCQNFSVDALRCMVEDRYYFERVFVSDYFYGLSDEDRMWFKSNVHDFSWGPQ